MRINRRELLKASGALVAASSFAGTDARGRSEMSAVRIRGKKLLDRGLPETYSGNELRFIGMPVGGLFAGTVYLGGDGQLWNWDIFNQERLGCVDRGNTQFMGDSLNAMGGSNYVDPIQQKSPFSQVFRVFTGREKPRRVRFGEVTFRGEYPVGRVEYRAADEEIEMSLEAFSPFCPLDAESSSYPATTLTYRVRNAGKSRLSLRLDYAIENPVLHVSKNQRADFSLTAEKTAGGGIQFGAKALPKPAEVRPDILIENWSSGTYGAWKPTGTAFGDRPQRVAELPGYMGSVQAGTEYVVNTHQHRNGEDVVQADNHVGTLTSPVFVASRRYLNLRVGGGAHAGTCVNILVDGKVFRTVSGRNSNAMEWKSLLIAPIVGKEFTIQVVDSVAGGWGQISLGEVILSDAPAHLEELEKGQDFGTFAVEVVGGANWLELHPDRAEVGQQFDLQPGETREVTFVVAWHFPNCAKNLPGKRHWYASRWQDAGAVASDLISRWPSLRKTTLDWNRTWYDSNLPYWFLDRTFVNTSILATTTCFRLDQGRYYFWEGVGCCAGTCTHVWGYAQAIGRVFPEVERYLRSAIDFGMAYQPETGAIFYRGDYHREVATDGQASCILRAYREHLTSPDLTFLKGIWPRVKGAMGYLIRQDAAQDGVLDGAQYNTLDTAWYGKIAWISSLHLAALRASEAMATEVGDLEFAKQCGEIAKRGMKALVETCFDGEYFINVVDPAHPEANNTNVGCHIDQVYGQSWAHQVGLPRVLPVKETRAALKALFRHNFYEDVWEYRRQNRAIPGGRWYATPQEPGLIMCTFPKGGADRAAGKSGDAWAVGYFNECMSGFEYQVAQHMISEGMLTEGLTIVRAIHERYHPSKRNPYNEVECSDHYGRAMASFGSYVSLTGMHVHGPSGTMSFAPKAGRALKCAFLNEKGWGTYERDASGKETTTYAYRVPRKG